MPRFFLTEITADRAVISGDDAFHITKTLRLKPGEAVTLCDGKGNDYFGTIESLGETVTVLITDSQPSISEPKAKLTLFQAMPKGDKFEYIVQKAVELGASVIVPVLTSRCVSRPDAKSMAKKLVRFQKIALEAAKQSGRGVIPEVCPLVTLKEAVNALPQNSIVFYEKGGERLNRLVSEDDTDIGVFVGSEGGFDQEEIQFLNDHGVKCATLGTRILRCETAPVCGLSVILSLTGDI